MSWSSLRPTLYLKSTALPFIAKTYNRQWNPPRFSRIFGHLWDQCKGRHQNSGEIPYLYIVKIDFLTPSPRLSLQPNFPFSMGKGKFVCKDRQLYPLPRLSLQCKDREFPRNFDVVPKWLLKLGLITTTRRPWNLYKLKKARPYGRGLNTRLSLSYFPEFDRGRHKTWRLSISNEENG